MFLWTDSSVKLTWISNPPSKWKDFVCNRVNSFNNCNNQLIGGLLLAKITQLTGLHAGCLHKVSEIISYGGLVQNGHLNRQVIGQLVSVHLHPKKC